LTSSDLPQGWRHAPISEVCRLINGRAFKPTDWSVSGLPIVRIQNLNDTLKSFNRYDGDVDPRFLIDSEELLFAWSGTPGTSFGAHIWRGGKAVLNQHIFRVIPNAAFVDKYFLRYAINERLQHLIGMAHGGAGLAHVTKPVFEATKVAVPPLVQQRRIVEKIEALTAKSRRAKEALDAIPPLLERFRQSVLAAAFCGDLTKDWRAQHPDVETADQLLARIRQERRHRWEQAQLEKLQAQGKKPKDDDWKRKYVEPEPVDPEGLPELPPRWCWAALGELTDDLAYGTSAKSSKEGRVPVLRMGNLQGGEVDWSDLAFTDDDNEISKYSLDPNTVLFNRTNSPELVGKTAIYRGERPAIFAGYLIRLGLLPSLSADYINLALNSPHGRDWCWSVKSDGVSQSNISASKLAMFPVPLCASVEQEAIAQRATRVLSIEATISEDLELAAAKSSVLDASILAKAFSGKLVDPAP
jgi:type I restriction enzyme S subunit